MAQTADRLVFITENVRSVMSQILTVPDSGIVPLGVDTNFFTPLSDEERNRLREELCPGQNGPIILFVGRMVEGKGVSYIRRLIADYPNWKWILVGRPDDFNPVEWEYPNLIYYARVSEDRLRCLYSIADLLIHPSRGEGFTLTASEAMACGTPVVISHESLEEINPRDRELFFPVEPRESEIGKTIAVALAQPGHLERLRHRVREYAINKLSWEGVCEQYLSNLKEILQNQHGSGRD
jgi:glycosyltransferase involved in cell wall biosynthesis